MILTDLRMELPQGAYLRNNDGKCLGEHGTKEVSYEA